MLDLDSPRTWTRLGAIYVLLSLPGWGAFVLGRLFETRNAYLLFSLMGLPLGLLFLVFGRGLRPPVSRCGHAARVAFLALSFMAILFLSFAGVKLGLAKLMTAVQFCAMAASYLSLLALVFLVAALFQRRPPASERTS